MIACFADAHTNEFLQNAGRATGWLASAEFGPRPTPMTTLRPDTTDRDDAIIDYMTGSKPNN
jgi:hypothetical protein